jgi:hypothetical protein
MRIVCLHPAGDPIRCGAGPIRIGSAPDDDIVPMAAGADPHHLTIAADARGLVLHVRSGCQRIYVNARAVRERALLRYGDTLTLGANRLLITSDAAPPPVGEAGASGAVAGRVTLRVVSGAASGQALAVAPELRLGNGSRHFGDLAYGCRVAQQGDALVFESDSASPRVNGWRGNRMRLSPGDQIVLDEHRLVVEAPGMQHAAHVASFPPPASIKPKPAPDESPRTEVWGLIAAAAILAAIIALFLYFRW